MPISVEAVLRRTPLYYGWYIVAIAFFTGFARAGFTGVLFSIFLKPMTGEFGWSRTAMTGAVTVGTIFAAVAGIVAGNALDRHGPRLLLTLGGIAVAAAYFGLAGVQGLVMFYVIYILGRAVTQSVLGESLVGAAVSKWFVRQRGMAVALGSMGTPFAGLVLATGLQAIINASSWRGAWLALGIIALVLLVVPPLLVLRRSPEDIGLLPDGASGEERSTVPAPAPAGNPHRPSAPSAEKDWSLREAQGTLAFWFLLAASSIGALGNTAINFHMVPHFTDVGVPPLAAATALGLFGLANSGSMPFWGFLTTRVHVRKVFIMANAVQVIGVGMILITRSQPMAYLSALVYGAGLGGFLTLLAVAWATYFGRGHLGAIRGWEITFRMMANAFGPLTAAMIYDATKSYTIAFSISFGIILLIMLLVFMAKPPRARTQAALSP